MPSRDLTTWIWADALSMLDQAERLHRHFFRAGSEQSGSQARCWEPPVDVVETDDAGVVHVALPGVALESLSVDADADGIRIVATRGLPAARSERIHRIEIPYGRFQRRIALPMHALTPAGQKWADGCLVLTFRKNKEMP